MLNDNNTVVKLEAQNIHCLDWGNAMANPSKFIVNKTGNSIMFTGEKCQEFIETISPKSLDGQNQKLKEHEWISIPSVGTPIIENDTLRFDINEPQFQGCEPKTILRITCYFVNGTDHKPLEFNGTRIDIKSLQGKEFEKCYAFVFMSGSIYYPGSGGRTRSGYFTPSGQIYDENDGNTNMAITVASSVGGAIVGLVILGNILNFLSWVFNLFVIKLSGL